MRTMSGVAAREHTANATPDPEPGASGLRRDLNAVDFTLLVIGAAIGADVYIVAALGAARLGPAQLVAWLLAGLLAALIALTFVQCAAICPEVGGSYAYARHAFGPFAGFTAGWALYVGEWIALPVFPLAFVMYLRNFVPHLTGIEQEMIRVALVAAVTGVNVIGVRMGGRLNDVLTVVKLLPLALLILVAIAFTLRYPSAAGSHLHPFVPLGWGGLGAAVVPIFWAYAGFELAVLPAGEVQQPRRTLPRGLLIGMTIVTGFYLLTSLAVVVALPWNVAASAPRPLADALGVMIERFGVSGAVGPALMSLGALISILGVFVVFTMSVARLSYAIATDGLFPTVFARLHPRFGTPYVGLLFQAVSALIIAPLFNLASLIDTAVVFLGVCYVLTALAASRLIRQSPQARLHLPLLRPVLWLGALASALLIAQAPSRSLFAGACIMLVGGALYALRAHAWRRSAALCRVEQQIDRWAWRGEHWLLHALRREAHRHERLPPDPPVTLRDS